MVPSLNGLAPFQIAFVVRDLERAVREFGRPARERPGPREVIVSRTVKDLVAGSGIEFDERGSAQLKGVPGEWQLYAVSTSG